MEQGSAPQEGIAGEQTSAACQQYEASRLATKRELSLLQSWSNFKYGNPVGGISVASGVAYWAKDQLNKSLKAA